MHEITVHHIIPKSHNSDFTYDVNNGIVLCKECHDLWHKDHSNDVGMSQFVKWLKNYE
jgi:5-methylcytosine-specific restriction endonuclease McrA